MTEDNTKEQQAVMQLIAFGGDSRSNSIEAIRAAKDGDFKKAQQKLKAANESLTKAHNNQTNFLTQEAQGKSHVTLFMVHAQDQVMNAMTIRDLAQEFIDVYKKMDQKSK